MRKKKTKNAYKKGENHSDPIYTSPIKNLPLFCTLFKGGGSRRAFTLPGEGGNHLHCARWNLRRFARSYSVSIFEIL